MLIPRWRPHTKLPVRQSDIVYLDWIQQTPLLLTTSDSICWSWRSSSQWPHQKSSNPDDNVHCLHYNARLWHSHILSFGRWPSSNMLYSQCGFTTTCKIRRQGCHRMTSLPSNIGNGPSFMTFMFEDAQFTSSTKPLPLARRSLVGSQDRSAAF